MGNLADVPIEPDEQTAVLNQTIALPGVIGGGVPGGMSPERARSSSQVMQLAVMMHYGCM